VASNEPTVHPPGDEHGEPQCNDIDRGKLLIHPPELSGKPTSSHPVPKYNEMAKEMMNFALGSITVHALKGF
jgi:hypothetical protein